MRFVMPLSCPGLWLKAWIWAFTTVLALGLSNLPLGIEAVELLGVKFFRGCVVVSDMIGILSASIGDPIVYPEEGEEKPFSS